MSKASRSGRARARSGRGALALLAAMVLVVTVGAASARADDDDDGFSHAWITTFAMSPRSGPPGTVVNVSGSGCAPGLLSSPRTDFVTVSAGTLDLAFQAPVAPNGSWQGSFTVPANPLGLPALVVAFCTSGSLRSLFTIYTPMTFTVSLPVVPPTLPVPPTTLPAPPPPPSSSTTTTPSTTTTIAPGPTTTPSTVPHSNGGGSGGRKPTPRPPVSIPGTKGGTPGPIPVAPGNGGLPPGHDSASGAPNTGAQPGSRTVSALRARPIRRSVAAPLPADLGTASLAALSVAGSDGLGWLVGPLLALVVAASLGAPALLWSRRRGNVARPSRAHS